MDGPFFLPTYDIRNFITACPQRPGYCTVAVGWTWNRKDDVGGTRTEKDFAEVGIDPAGSHSFWYGPSVNLRRVLYIRVRTCQRSLPYR